MRQSKLLSLLLLACCIALFVLPTGVPATEREEIPLPPPRTEGGMPLMQALKERQSARAFSAQSLPDQVLADLLWAAFGVNRPDSGRRTAPSARNWQEVDIYLITEQYAAVYDPMANTIRVVVADDLRPLAGRQEFAAAAPLNLVFVADVSRMKGASPEDIPFYAGADVGFISQNVYLFSASEGLATVVRASVDREALADALLLNEHQRVIFVQSVGYPAGTAP